MSNSTLEHTKKLIAAGFVHNLDTSTMTYTDLWTAKPSFNGAVTAYVILTQHTTEPVVEYTTNGFPDLSFLDAQDVAEEIFTYTSEINTETVFAEEVVFGTDAEIAVAA